MNFLEIFRVKPWAKQQAFSHFRQNSKNTKKREKSDILRIERTEVSELENRCEPAAEMEMF